MEQKPDDNQKIFDSDKKSVQKKINRMTIWSLFLLVVGSVASFVIPEHSINSFFGLLKDIIVYLISGT